MPWIEPMSVSTIASNTFFGRSDTNSDPVVDTVTEFNVRLAATKYSSLPLARHDASEPPCVETGILRVAVGNRCTYISGRPVSSEVKAIHRPSGDSRAAYSLKFVANTTTGLPSPDAAILQMSIRVF